MEKLSARAKAEWRTLLLKYFIRGELQWEFFSNSSDGELCVGGLRYSCGLDDFGCPVYNSHVHNELCRRENTEIKERFGNRGG